MLWLPGDSNQLRRMLLVLHADPSPLALLSQSLSCGRWKVSCPFPTVVFGMLTTSSKGDDLCPGPATDYFPLSPLRTSDMGLKDAKIKLARGKPHPLIEGAHTPRSPPRVPSVGLPAWGTVPPFRLLEKVWAGGEKRRNKRKDRRQNQCTVPPGQHRAHTLGL